MDHCQIDGCPDPVDDTNGFGHFLRHPTLKVVGGSSTRVCSRHHHLPVHELIAHGGVTWFVNNASTTTRVTMFTSLHDCDRHVSATARRWLRDHHPLELAADDTEPPQDSNPQSG